MNVSSRRSLVLKLSFILAVLLVFTPLLFLHLPNLQPRLVDLHRTLKIHKDPSEKFIEKVLTSSIEGEYDSKALAFVCEKTQWTEGLIFSCEGLQGGIGNFRNVLLNCVRFAIEAGGTNLYFPKAQRFVRLIAS
jgi:hypothetical protein